MSNESTPCFVAICKCGCGKLVFASVDKPEMAKDNAKEVAKLIRDGLTIEKMTVADVRTADWHFGA